MKILLSIFMPLSLLIIITFVSGWYIGKRLGKILIVLSISIYILSIRPVADSLRGMMVDEYKVYDSKYSSCDTAVILGGDINKRLMSGVMLNHKYNIPIIVSGGFTRDWSDISEAQEYKEYLALAGVDEDKIIIEDRSTNTFENAIYTKEIVKKLGFEKMCLITSPLHMKRSVYIFKKYDLDIVPVLSQVYHDVPFKYSHLIPSANSLKVSTNVIMELIGLIYYKVRY
jgi:uncharacterized SAM-binding protein YcdF (DUF218 family)